MLHRMRLPASISVVVVLSVVLVIVLGGCGSTANANALSSTSGLAASGAPTIAGIAPLRSQPNGPVDLTWDPGNDNTLVVNLAPSGLSPMSSSSYKSVPYPATLGTGSCQQLGNVVH